MRFVLCLLFAGLGQAAISGARVVGATNVQALISFDVPEGTACTIAVSESASFAPLVHDLDPALFPGSDSAARTGAVAEGATHYVVVGKRAVDRAADGKWYSRALQADTVHYYRVRCGEDTAAGVFRTANIPVGATYPWPFPQDPKTGQTRWPSLDNNDRSQRVIDPNYGTLIRRVSVPGEAPGEVDARKRTFQSAAGEQWSDPISALALDGTSARAVAAGAWLTLTKPNTSSFGEFYVHSLAIDRIVVRVTGSAPAEDEASRRIQVCLTLDGGQCAGGMREATLDRTASTKTLGDGFAPPDTWGIDALFPVDLLRNDRFGVMVRGPEGTTIDGVDFDVFFSEDMTMPDNGFQKVCAPQKMNGGYRCAIQSSQGVDHLFWINSENGDVRWLGRIVARGWGGNDTLCATPFAMFDPQDPNTYYCQAWQDKKTLLLKGTYTGNDVAQKPGSDAPFHWTVLTPPGQSITEQVQRFNASYTPDSFLPLTLVFVTGKHAIYRAWRDGQDGFGWIAAFDLGNGEPLGSGGTGKITAVTPTWTMPATRWCGIHAVLYAGKETMLSFDSNHLMYGGAFGWGPFKVTLESDLPPQTGTFTVKVSGDPAPFLQPALPGDLFVFQLVGWGDYLRLVQKNSATEWVVERVVQGRDPVLRARGSELYAFCSARKLDEPAQGAYVYWDFAQDPLGEHTVVEHQLTGGHIAERGDFRIMEASDGYSVITPGLPASFNQPRNYGVIGNPKWEGKQANHGGNGLGLGYQQHLSFENWAAVGRSNWFVDMVPFVGGIPNQLSAVAGFTQVYKVDREIQPEAFPTFAVCGGRQLQAAAGPMRDDRPFTFCTGEKCVDGAGPGDVYVNCPPPVTAKSQCDHPAKASSVCVGDMSPYGQTISQFFLDPSGRRSRVLSTGLYAWENLGRTNTYFDTAYSLPDGKWLLFASYANNGRKDLYLLKVPPQPEFPDDPLEGSQPVSRTVDVSVPEGASQVTLANAWRTDAANCRAGQSCTVTVSLRPMELLAAPPEFRNASGSLVGKGTVQVALPKGTDAAALPPSVSDGGVRNAFSLEPQFAPGTVVSIFGQHLAACVAQAGAPPLPLELCGTAVTVNGSRVPLFAVLPGQINAQLPISLAPGQQFELAVETSTGRSTVTVPADRVTAVAPALATYSPESVVRAIVAYDDGSLNGPDAPMTAGRRGTAYAIGLGPAQPPVADGEAPPADVAARPIAEVQVVINGVTQPAEIILAPGAAALCKVTFTLAAETPVQGGGSDRIWLRAGDVESPHVPVALKTP